MEIKSVLFIKNSKRKIVDFTVKSYEELNDKINKEKDVGEFYYIFKDKEEKDTYSKYLQTT